LSLNWDLEYKKIIKSTNLTELNEFGKHLFKIRCSSENKIDSSEVKEEYRHGSVVG
jgi:hypothetical protein